MIEEIRNNRKILENNSKTFDDSEFYTKINDLRPKKLEEFIGQDHIKQQLKIYIESAKKRKKIMDHILLYGPAGLGKTTLATIIANEMGSNIKIVSAPVFEKTGDIAALLSSLKEGDFLFIDEIHRLKISLEETLFLAMEDFKLDIMLGKGPTAKNIRLNLPGFTLIGATTKAGNISQPLRTRFGIILKLDYYNVESLASIIKNASKKLDIKIEESSTKLIAERSRGTPRIALRLLKRVYDYAIVHKKNIIDNDIVEVALKDLGIDKNGFDSMDRKLLKVIIENYKGGPVGLQTLAVSIGEDSKTIEDYYEPYLILKGFLKRTPKGRVATEKAYKYFNIKQMDDNKTLF